MVLDATALSPSQTILFPSISVRLSYAALGIASTCLGGKKKLDNGFPCLDCFAKPAGAKSTPSDLNDLVFRSSLD